MPVRKRLTRPRRLVLASAALLALGSGALAAAPAALPSPADGLNILVTGVDSRQGVTAQEKAKHHLGGTGCDCTDVMMLVHISAKNDRVSVVSLPRDSLTAFRAGHYDQRTGAEHGAHPAKINAAHTEGGPAFTVETVERMTGTPVHRYLEIDFRRFMDGVNRLENGVPVCTKVPLKDPVTGLDLPPGTTRVAGGEALQFVRSRRADGKMDFGRMQKQQQFFVNTLRKVRTDLLRDPDALRTFASTLRGTAEVERGLSVTDMLTLAVRLRDLTPSRTEFATVPVAGFKDVAGAGSTVVWNEEQAAEIFERLRTDQPLPKAATTPTSTIPQGLGEYRPTGGASLLCAP
ncbi:LCP family protein [Streptomyces sp. NPDC053755]|uniref:LCP family protein n=1 Tax=Streptomyces sp. NPDC053755 TaxID=3155815 RepID=UPI00343C8CD7